jgi:5-methylcytosine-specific restriction endonuclease McrA
LIAESLAIFEDLFEIVAFDDPFWVYIWAADSVYDGLYSTYDFASPEVFKVEAAEHGQGLDELNDLLRNVYFDFYVFNLVGRKASVHSFTQSGDASSLWVRSGLCPSNFSSEIDFSVFKNKGDRIPDFNREVFSDALRYADLVFSSHFSCSDNFGHSHTLLNIKDRKEILINLTEINDSKESKNMNVQEPLRKCKICGLEAYNDADLEKFKKSPRHKYHRDNICKKCHNAIERHRKRKFRDQFSSLPRFEESPRKEEIKNLVRFLAYSCTDLQISRMIAKSYKVWISPKRVKSIRKKYRIPKPNLEYICVTCGESFKPQKSNQKYCPKCAGLSKEDRIRKSRLFKLYKRYEGLCQKCGGKGEVVHHINQDELDNRIENLILLCHNCHNIYHANIPSFLTKKALETIFRTWLSGSHTKFDVIPHERESLEAEGHAPLALEGRKARSVVK